MIMSEGGYKIRNQSASILYNAVEACIVEKPVGYLSSSVKDYVIAEKCGLLEGNLFEVISVMSYKLITTPNHFYMNGKLK